jgi:CheY-like chemotaxis protein
MNGWSVLDALKENTGTRHIPVHIASAEESSSESVRKGAVGHATKPLSQKDLEDAFRRLEQVSDGKPKCVLVVDDNPEIRRSTVKLISDDGVKVEEVENGKQALVSLRSGHYDCMILDLGLPDMDGLKLLERVELEGIKMPPVIVYTSRDLTMDEEIKLREHAEAVVIKDVRSQERLLDEVSLFLHRVVSKMPEKQRKIIRDLHSTDELLRDRKVLIVDDDMRTAFAMSRLLSDCGMQTLKAENGDKALRLLEENQDVDIVLMDIMMPIMDGYEAMKRIRSQERLRRLPIIVLTAKAMPEDREKCLTAGANDYLSKPVDQKRLLSMMRVWLCR